MRLRFRRLRSRIASRQAIHGNPLSSPDSRLKVCMVGFTGTIGLEVQNPQGSPNRSYKEDAYTGLQSRWKVTVFFRLWSLRYVARLGSDLFIPT